MTDAHGPASDLASSFRRSGAFALLPPGGGTGDGSDIVARFGNRLRCCFGNVMLYRAFVAARIHLLWQGLSSHRFREICRGSHDDCEAYGRRKDKNGTAGSLRVDPHCSQQPEQKAYDDRNRPFGE